MTLETAEKFVRGWTQHYNDGDWEHLLALGHDPNPKEGSDRHRRGLHESGFRVVSSEIRPFSYPKWSIFREFRLHPKPEYWVDLFLESAEGRKNQMYLALAPCESGYRTCYYVEAKTKVVRKLDLQSEAERVSRFLMSAGKAVSKLKSKPVELVEIQFSIEQGFVHLGLDTESSEPGRIIAHPEFRVLPRPNWAAFAEMGEELVDLMGNVLHPNPADGRSFGARQDCTLCTLIGEMLVAAVKKHRDDGLMATWNLSATAQFGVSEIEGRFGFPPYEERGQDNRL